MFSPLITNYELIRSEITKKISRFFNSLLSYQSMFMGQSRMESPVMWVKGEAPTLLPVHKKPTLVIFRQLSRQIELHNTLQPNSLLGSLKLTDLNDGLTNTMKKPDIRQSTHRSSVEMSR